MRARSRLVSKYPSSPVHTECSSISKPPRRVRRHDESESLGAAGARQDVAHDADDFAGEVEHRAARVALVDRRVGLEQLGRHEPARPSCLAARRALMCPTVNVCAMPSGAPITNIDSPTSAGSESPSFAGAMLAGTCSTSSNATSALGSDATTRAATTSPSANSTATASAVCTTCAAVSTLPSAADQNARADARRRSGLPVPAARHALIRAHDDDGAVDALERLRQRGCRFGGSAAGGK